MRRAGDTQGHDLGWTPNYTIGSTEKTFTASGTFPPGSYLFWFAYLQNGQWHEHNKRAFTITDTGIPDIPLDPVAENEQAGVLKWLGNDTKKGLKNAAIRFAAQLSSPTDLPIDDIAFIIRDAADKNLDLHPVGDRPTLIGDDLKLSAQGFFPAGRYRYWVAYHQNGVWHDLGEPRTFVVEPTPPVPVPPNAAWQLNPQASDEFTGHMLDLSKWQYDIGYPVSSALAFKNSNVQVTDGHLVLTARTENFKGKAYTIGAVQSLFDVPGQPSYVEVRAKALDRRANVLSAIWLQSTPLSSTLNPNPEIDLQETFDYQQMISTLHTWVRPNEHVQVASNKFPVGTDVSQAFHTYGLERRGGWLRFYFDGRLAWEIKPALTEEALATLERHVILSLEGHLGAPQPEFLPSTFLIDYVRTYRYTGP